MTPNTPMTELPVEDLETAVRAFMPLAQVAFLWTHEASPPEDEIQRYRDAYHNVLLALRQSDTSEGGDWSSEGERGAAIAGEIAAYDYSKSGGGPIGSFLAGLTAYRAYLTTHVNKSPTPEHDEGEVLSADHIADAGKMVGEMGEDPNKLAAELLEYAERCSDPTNETLRAAAAYISAATTRIQRAERERNEARHDNSDLLAAADADAFVSCNLRAQLADAVKVLKPFAAHDWADEHGWNDHACRNDRICDWFGPSDFRAARAFLSTIGEKPDAE